MDGQRLFLGKVPDDFNASTDVAIAPWCFLGREDDFDSWRTLPFSSPFDSEDEQKLEAHRCHQLYYTLLSEHINIFVGQYPGTPAVYWERTLGPWLFVTICMAWSRYLLLDKFFITHGAKKLTTFIVSKNQRVQLDSMEQFTHLIMRSTSFNHWLVSRLVEAMAPSCLTLIQLPEESQGWEMQSPPPVPHLPSKGLKKRLKDWVNLAVTPLSGSSFIERAILAINLYLCPKRQPMEQGARIDLKENLGFPQIFLDLLPSLLVETLPLSLRKAPPATKVGRPWLRIRLPDCWSDEERRHNAWAQSQGVRFAFAQHGGNYGVSVPYSGPPQFEYGADAFLTWGWTRHSPYKGNNFIPLPCPMLGRLRNRHSAKIDGALLISSMSCAQFDGIFWPQTGNSIIEYICQKERLIKLLNDHGFPFQYRPFLFEEQTARFEKWFAKRNANLRTVNGSLWQRALESKLIILDHYSTPFHEALVTNVPTICLWGPQTPGVCREAKPIFEKLRACGVICDTPEVLVETVVRVWPNLQDWWQGAELQGARQEFCQNYALSSRWWLYEWTLKMRKI